MSFPPRLWAALFLAFFLQAGGCSCLVDVEKECSVDDDCPNTHLCLEKSGSCVLDQEDKGATDAGAAPVDAGAGTSPDSAMPGMDSGLSPDAGTAIPSDAGPDGGAPAPMDSGLDAGSSGDLDAGLDSGAVVGMDSGVAPGMDSGADSGVDAGALPGMDSGVNSGADSGTDSGMDAGLDSGAGADLDSGADGGFPPARSCLEALQNSDGGPLSDGVYTVDPDGPGGIDPFDVHCDMTRQGGGWMLALKADGRASTFAYDAPFWTNDTLLNPSSTNLLMEEAKLQPFVDAPVGEVMVLFSDNDADGGSPQAIITGEMVLPARADSLKQLFSFGRYQASHQGRSNWLGAINGGAIQNNCNMEGFNVWETDRNDWEGRVRIGIIGNDEDNCLSSDSILGVGGAGYSCRGSVANSYVSVGSSTLALCNISYSDVPAFASVWVRETLASATPTRASCQAHLGAGEMSSGTYWVDPDGSGGVPAVEVYCDQIQSGGGWMLVGKSGSKQNGEMGWNTSWGNVLDDTNHYSLDVRGYGFDPANLIFGNTSGAKAWGSNVYSHSNLNPGWLTTHLSDEYSVAPEPTVEAGSCTPLGDTMFKHVGYTSLARMFYFRDTGWAPENSLVFFGLTYAGWELFFDNCQNAGDIDGDPGMIMVK
jgi:hypothetical protein